jgi:hypothetical protein
MEPKGLLPCSQGPSTGPYPEPDHVGPLSPRHAASSVCGWRKWPPDMEGSCEYTEKAVADSRQGVVL